MIKNKVLIFSHEFPPFCGGVGVVAYQYCIELNKQGNDVTLLTRHQNIFPKDLKGINIITVPHIPKLWFIPYYFKLKKINLTQFDSIILNCIVSGFVAGKYFNQNILNKCTPILHGGEPEDIYNQPSIDFKIIKFKNYYNKMLDSSRKIIAVSNYMKEKFLAQTTFKNDKKIEVVYAGLSDDFFIGKEVNCKDIFEYKNKEIILTVSRIEKDKGFLDMYEVFKTLIKKDDTFIWIIVGDGKFKIEFENTVLKDKLESKVIFKGKTPRNKLYKYYKCADVFWLLSKYKESFGLVYIEAQAYGCPAIGYNRYGVKEAIGDKKAGFLVDKASDSLEIFLKRKYKKLLVKNIKNFALMFKSKK